MAKKPMDPFARKMVQGTFVYGAVMLVMFGVFTAVYLHTRPRCSDRVVAEAISPGRQWTATVMERRCGDEAPFFTHVNLRPANQDLRHGFFSGSTTEGEIFLVEQDSVAAGITLQWTAPDTLSIHCESCNPALEKERIQNWGKVTVTYSTSSS
ncbi:MAG TPA: hypothetical protein VKH81_11730 [Candidatus Angelobacter sp.]|nr:hypothetical protein [Candidatus Angelobacter sp.]